MMSDDVVGMKKRLFELNTLNNYMDVNIIPTLFPDDPTIIPALTYILTTEQ